MHLAQVIRDNADWMVWNTLLAWLPVGLAGALFSGRSPGHRPTPAWWSGLALFVLFLPNAPYVVTDLVHLRGDVLLVGRDLPVLTSVLPVYAAFVGSGLLAYYLALRSVGRYLDDVGLEAWRPIATVGLHGLCAVGVVLGRMARLNSWEPVVEPRDAFQRVVLTLSWRWAPVLIAATFMLTWAGHFVTRAVIETAGQSLRRLPARVWGA